MQKSLKTRPQEDPEQISSSLRALAAIASRLGLDVSFDQLRRRFALPHGEPETPQLIAIARELGLEARAVRMGFQELPRVARALPAILRARDGGALILEEARTDPAKGTVAIIRDPTAAEDVLLAIDELHLAEVWEGEVILIKRKYAATDEQQPFGPAWLWSQVLKERKLFRDIIVASFISTIFAIAPAFIFRIILDRVIVENSYPTLNIISGAIVFLIVFETILTYLRRILTQVITTRIDGRLSLYIMEKVLKLPMDYFENNPTGRIMTNLQQIWMIRNFLTGQLFGAMLDIIPLVGLIPVMIMIEWHLAILAFALGAMIFLIVLVYLRPMSLLFRNVVIAEQAKGSYLSETLYGMRTIKSLVLEGRRRQEWDHRVAAAVSARHSFGLMSNYPETLSLPFQRLMYAGCLAVGAYMILANQTMLPVPTGTTGGLGGALGPGGALGATGALGTSPLTTITPGALVAFALLSMRLAAPLVKLAELQRDLAELRGSIGQVAQVVNAAPEEARPNGLRLPIKGDVTFQDVRFRYTPSAPYALDEVSFNVPAGTMLGIMGRSGSGKTTVTRLLQCLNSNYEGVIKIDGMDLREIDLMHLRTHIGVVPQENFLFSGTIRDNIAMAKPDASFVEVVRAAQLSGAEEFIEKLPRGYDTEIHEGGSNLSGGQRQRIALARALLIDPPILILDEATSALDAESEAIVNANLKRMAKGRTVLSISHRLSMLVESDAILVLEQGRLYDTGTHEELLRRCDIYKHLWFTQNRHLDSHAADSAVSNPRGAVR
jgi:ATP-binding cassette, subfamily B, bacterial HlyB/CyaB